MPLNANIQVRVDEKDREEADELFSSLGLETSTAIRMFLKRAIKMQAFPFELNNPITTKENGRTIMTVRDFRDLFGSGCLFNLGTENQKEDEWIFEKVTLFDDDMDAKLEEYDDVEVCNFHTITDKELGAILVVVIDN